MAVAVLMVSLAAVAAGGVFGLQLQALVDVSRPRTDEAAAVETEKIGDSLPGTPAIRTLPPVITNLAGPQRALVRIEASIVLGDGLADDGDLLAATISQDIVAFLQTVSIDEIEGASGFQHLREDLSERARVRSDGRVRDLVIHTFVVE